MIKRNNGITLIALVVTIIVLLILAGVSIAMLTGENGILTQARNAKEKTAKATEEEKIKLAVVGSSISDDGLVEILDETSFKQELANQFGEDNFKLTANKGGSFLITVNDSKREYYVGIDKEIINSDNILKINNSDELKKFRDDVNNGNTYEEKVVLLTENIDLQGENWERIGVYIDNSTEDEEIIISKPFKGIFDGFGHEVDNFTLDATDNAQGLFGDVSNAEILNLGVGEDASIRGDKNTGGVIGSASTGTKIYNCYNKARIESESTVGGVVGGIYGNCLLINCYNSGSVTTNARLAGGVVGNCDISSQILNCYNIGNVEGILPGGIVGQVYDESIIENCYNIGNITKIGGDTFLSYSYYGIVGGLKNSEEDNSEVNNCYYLNGSVNGGNEIDKCEGVINKSSDELKMLSFVLGNAFKEDKDAINNGYPILFWQ